MSTLHGLNVMSGSKAPKHQKLPDSFEVQIHLQVREAAAASISRLGVSDRVPHNDRAPV